MALEIGSAFAKLGARIDNDAFDRFDRRLEQTRRKAQKPIEQELRADADTRDVEKFNRSLKDTEEHHTRLIRAQGRMRTAFGSVWSSGGAAFAAAGAAYGMAAGIKSAVGAASDINESLTKNKTLFGDYARGVESFSKTSARSFGISRAAALEYTGVFGNLSRAIGINQKDSAGLSVRLTKLAADMASFNNTSIEDALEALRSGLVGETEPLRRFGVTLSANAVAAEAMRSGVVKVKKETYEYRAASLAVEKAQKAQNDAIRQHGKDSIQAREASLGLEKANRELTKTAAGGKVELTAQQKAIATTNLVMRQTRNAHGDFARTAGGAANQQRILTARFADARAQIGEKLLPILVQGTRGLNRFLDQMRTGRGVGGQFADVLGKVGRFAKKMSDDLVSNERQVGGWISGLGRAESTALKFAGTLVGGRVGGKLKEWGRNVDDNADAIDRWREQLTIDAEVDAISADIDRLKRKTTGSFRDIRLDAKHNMDRIRESMTLESAAGRRAFGRNIAATVAAIRTAMKDGRVSAATGLAEIRKLFLIRLKELGIREAERLGAPLDPDNPRAAYQNKARGGLARFMGGWIGGRGGAGMDTVPAMLGEGEAVLNRHQQSVVEGLLGDGFLDHLFATVTRPHYAAQGGRIGRAVRRFARGGDAGGRFLQLPENIHRTHDTDGLAGYPAEDIFASPGTHVGAPIDSRVSKLSGSAGGPGGGKAFGYSIYLSGKGRTYFLTHFGSRNVTLGQHVSRGQDIGTVADYPGGVPDHIHEGVHGGGELAVSGAGGAAAIVRKAWRAITAPRTGMGGLIGDVVQGELTNATRAANRAGRRRADAAGGGGGGGQTSAGGQYNKSRLMELWHRVNDGLGDANLMAAIALAESGGDPNIVNSIGATGLWQIHPGGPQYKDPVVNARTAGMKLRTQGLSAWEVYTKGTYRQFLSRGGLARFAGGGRATKKAKPKRQPTLSAKANRGIVRSVQRGERGIGGFEEDIRNLERDYDIANRRAELDPDDFLVEHDDGSITIDVAAQRDRRGELNSLVRIREKIGEKIAAYRAAVGRAVRAYTRGMATLRKALGAAKGKARAKERGGYREKINTYAARRKELRGVLTDLRFDAQDAGIDLDELAGELQALGSATGTPATPETPDTGDTGGGGADTSTPDTPELVQLPPTPADIAAAAIAQVATFQQGRADLFGQFGANFTRAGALSSVGELGEAAGGRFFGGGSGGSGPAGVLDAAGGISQTLIFTGPHPTDPHTFTQAALHELKAAI